MKRKNTTLSKDRHESREAPVWMLIAGLVSGGATLLFFMILVTMSLRQQEVPKDSRFLVVVVMAFGAALASAFLGGHAAVSGQLPLPIGSMSKETIMKFSAAGGISVLIIFIIVGYILYAKPASGQKKNLEDYAVTATGFGYPREDKEGKMTQAERCGSAEFAARIVARAELAKLIGVQMKEIAITHNQVISSSAATSYVNKYLPGSEVIKVEPSHNCDRVDVTVGTKSDIKILVDSYLKSLTSAK